MTCGDGPERRAKPPLTRLTGWTQALVGEVLSPGDLAVDLTAGNGRDTLYLFRRVGPAGCVLAFDVQEEALRATAALLHEAEARVHFRSAGEAGEAAPGVHLLAGSHEALAISLKAAPRAVIANLGFLPGGDPLLTTSAGSTLSALGQACRALQPGGRIAVTVYVGHKGGREEGEVVAAFFAALPSRQWSVLRLEVPNCAMSPWSVVAEKLTRG